MAYDFDTVIDRRGTHCEKWDQMERRYGVSPEEGLAMWVADMEFLPPPEVDEAIMQAAGHGIHGYPGDLAFYREAIAGWMRRRHGWEIEPDWILTTHGIVNAVSLLIQTFCEPGDGVILQPPVYHPFFGAVTSNGCELILNPLVPFDGSYRMDLEGLERRCGPNARMFLLCSPHNPGGRVWTKDELDRLARFCLERDILIVSDEIHHDLVYDGFAHTVTASLGPEVARRTVTCTSASKTFNLAGTMTGNVIISDDTMRHRFRQRLKSCGIHSPNRFGPLTGAAAYDHGEPWLEELMAYLKGNRDRVESVLGDRLPEVIPASLEATYLAWLDFSPTGLTMDEIVRRVQEGAKLALNHGPTFGPGGEHHLRLNFACPRIMLDDALERLVGALTA